MMRREPVHLAHISVVQNLERWEQDVGSIDSTYSL